jgi:hypothetical protein
LDPLETLKLIELATQEEPARMDRGFTAYSECSNIGTYSNNTRIKFYFHKFYTTASDDECATAGDIYKCGIDKVPDVVEDMVDIAKGGPEIVISSWKIGLMTDYHEICSLYLQLNVFLQERAPLIECLAS